MLMTLVIYALLIVLGLIALGTIGVLGSWVVELAGGWLRQYRQRRAIRRFSSSRR